nr:MAG TPA: hypothetical protein [Caudoviricetes sp.]
MRRPPTPLAPGLGPGSERHRTAPPRETGLKQQPRAGARTPPFAPRRRHPARNGRPQAPGPETSQAGRSPAREKPERRSSCLLGQAP